MKKIRTLIMIVIATVSIGIIMVIGWVFWIKKFSRKAEIQRKISFIYNQDANSFIAKLNEFNVDIPIEGKCDFSDISDVRMKCKEHFFNIDKPYYRIDPFLNGDYNYSVNNVEDSIIFFPGSYIRIYPKKLSYNAAPVKYITNKNDIFICIYAGPDGDIDNEILQNEFKLPDADSFQPRMSVKDSEVYLWHIPIVDNNIFLQYDPTNGLFSNGDIVDPLYYSKDLKNFYRAPEYRSRR